MKYYTCILLSILLQCYSTLSSHLPSSYKGEEDYQKYLKENEEEFFTKKLNDRLLNETITELIKFNWQSSLESIVYIAHHSKKYKISNLSKPTIIGTILREKAKDLRKLADDLVKTLDVSYFKPTRVSPAFLWAQNDTAIFLQVKLTRRFNAPGALDARNIQVNPILLDDKYIMGFSFSAEGVHSNKKYLYNLNISQLYDYIDEDIVWQEGSVGKINIILTKNRPSRWPRLLATRKKVYDNMHYWFEYGEALSKLMKIHSISQGSPSSCSLLKDSIYYCPHSDKCVKSCKDQCSPTSEEMNNYGCFEPTINDNCISHVDFRDEDHTRGLISGDVLVYFDSKCSYKYLIDSVVFGKCDGTKYFEETKSQYFDIHKAEVNNGTDLNNRLFYTILHLEKEKTYSDYVNNIGLCINSASQQMKTSNSPYEYVLYDAYAPKFPNEDFFKNLKIKDVHENIGLISGEWEIEILNSVILSEELNKISIFLNNNVELPFQMPIVRESEDLPKYSIVKYFGDKEIEIPREILKICLSNKYDETCRDTHFRLEEDLCDLSKPNALFIEKVDVITKDRDLSKDRLEFEVEIKLNIDNINNYLNLNKCGDFIFNIINIYQCEPIDELNEEFNIVKSSSMKISEESLIKSIGYQENMGDNIELSYTIANNYLCFTSHGMIGRADDVVVIRGPVDMNDLAPDEL